MMNRFLIILYLISALVVFTLSLTILLDLPRSINMSNANRMGLFLLLFVNFGIYAISFFIGKSIKNNIALIYKYGLLINIILISIVTISLGVIGYLYNN